MDNPAGQGQPAQPPSNSNPEAAHGEAPKPDERYEKMEQLVLGLKKQFDGLAAATRASQKAKDNDAPTTEQHVTLKGLKAELEARDARTRDRAINVEVDSYLKMNGVPEAQAKILKAYIRSEYAAQKDADGNFVKGLSTDENDQVFYQDEIGNRKPFADIGKQVLSGLGVQGLIPIQTPGQVGSRNPFGQPQTLRGSGQIADITQMSVEEMMKSPKQAEEAIRALAGQVRRNNTTITGR